MSRVRQILRAAARPAPWLARHGVTILMAEIGTLFAMVAARDLDGLLIGVGATTLPALVRVVRDEDQHRRDAARARTADIHIAGDARQLLHMPLQLRPLAMYLEDAEPISLANLAERSREGALRAVVAIGSEGHALAQLLDQLWNWFAGATSPYLPIASPRARELVHEALDALSNAFQVTSTLNMLSAEVVYARSQGAPEPEHGAELIDASWPVLERWVVVCAAAAEHLDRFDLSGAESATRSRRVAAAERHDREQRALTTLVENARGAIGELRLDVPTDDLAELRARVERAYETVREVPAAAIAEATVEARDAHRAIAYGSLGEAAAASDPEVIRRLLTTVSSQLSTLESLRA